jgi:hypothetical protein
MATAFLAITASNSYACRRPLPGLLSVEPAGALVRCAGVLALAKFDFWISLLAVLTLAGLEGSQKS